MNPILLLRGIPAKGKLVILCLLVLLFFGAKAWIKGKIEQAGIDGFNACLDSVTTAPVHRDTVYQSVEIPVIKWVVRAKTDTITIDNTPQIVKTAESEFAQEVSGVKVSGKLHQSYNPTSENFSSQLFFNPFRIPTITETKVVKEACPEYHPPWFSLTTELTFAGLLHDKILDLENKAVAFTVTPTFASNRVFSISVPIGIVMIPRSEHQNDLTYIRNSYKSDLGFGVVLKVFLLGQP